MTSAEAREILALYRPGSTDAADAQMAEALDQVRRDPELAAWFKEHSAVNAAIRAKFKAIPVPRGLKRQIIIGRMEHTRIVPLPAAVKILAAAAAIVILTAIVWRSFYVAPNPNDFAHYREHFARIVQRGNPYMTILSTNQAEILAYFQKQGAPVDFVISTNLQQLPGEGGSVLPWNNQQQVEMLCLNAGVAGAKNDLWLFVMNKSAFPDAPPAKPRFLQVANLMTASWTAGGRVYLLAGAGAEADLQKYLDN